MTIVQTDMLDLGRKQADMFLANNTAYSEILVTCSCPRHILVMAYSGLVARRKITALEDMSYQDQKSAGETAKEIAKGRLPRKALIELVKALLTIEYFLNL